MPSDTRRRWTPNRPGERPLGERRDIKVQIAMSESERLLLEDLARAAHADSLAGYIRSRALAQPTGAV